MTADATRSGPPGLPLALSLSLPFTGRWIVRNSPARRVPSHGTDLLGTSYAIDFVAVDGQRRTARSRSWRTVIATEPPDIFLAFGRPVLAPLGGTVVAVHDGAVDHSARRSQISLLPYMLGQSSRLRRGVNAMAGKHVIIAAVDNGSYVAVVHLQAGSVDVRVGQRIDAGHPVARCGNSGNSTQPHVHVQAMDSTDLTVARGLPIEFTGFTEWRAGEGTGAHRKFGLPQENSVVEAWAGG